MGNFILIWSVDCDFNFAIGTHVIVVKIKITANFYRKSVSKMINMVVFTCPGNLKQVVAPLIAAETRWFKSP